MYSKYFKILSQVALYINEKEDLDLNCKMCQSISWKLILYLKAPIIRNILFLSRFQLSESARFTKLYF